MFESISFAAQNKRDSSHPIDIGRLVECMLFYKKTIVIANRNILTQLLKFFGVDRTVELIEEDLLQIIYTESHVGIHTHTLNNIQFHKPVSFSSPQHTYPDEIRKICIEVTGKSGKGRRAAQRIEGKIRVTQHKPIILEGATKSFLDQDYISRAAKTIITNLAPEFPDFDNLVFTTEKTSNGIEVASNINLAKLNEIYHKRVPPSHSTITPAFILSHVLDMESELYFSSFNLSELATNPLSSNLIEQKINYVLEKSRGSEEKIEEFQGFIFSDSKALREGINNNAIDIDELMAVLKKANKFKGWIAGLDPDENLIKSYYSEVTKDSFVDKLPVKSTRWVIFTGLGLLADIIATGGLGTASGIALGALDTFYIDKLISGWKPNQFIEDEVRKLV